MGTSRLCVCDNYRPGEPYDVAKDCRLCWLYHNDVRYRAMWDNTPAAEAAEQVTADEPGLIQQAWSYPQALALHVARGLPEVDEVTYNQRISLCLACPNVIDRGGGKLKCRVCGCHLEEKARWADARCPLEPPKWDVHPY